MDQLDFKGSEYKESKQGKNVAVKQFQPSSYQTNTYDMEELITDLKTEFLKEDQRIVVISDVVNEKEDGKSKNFGEFI